MRGLGASVALVIMAAAPVFAQEPALPRSRPLVEPPPATAEWAGSAAAHFGEAKAGIPIEAPLPHPRPAQAGDAVGSIAAAPVAVSADATTGTPPAEASASAPTAPEASAREEAPHALDAIDALAPLPRPRPHAAVVPELAMFGPPRIDREPSPVAPEDPGCIDELRALGVAFTEGEPLDPGGSCEVKHPLTVTSFGSGVSVAPETILNCAETLAMAKWVKEAVVPVATRLFGEAPTAIRQDSAYVCRNRYNDPHAKISEHAHANALDIAAIEFGKRNAVEIGRNAGDPLASRFEAAIRAESCSYFTTVIGPGSNAAHATHFHLDMAYRRGGYRLCELGAPTEVRAAPAKAKRE